jgi:hypothetical protein
VHIKEFFEWFGKYEDRTDCWKLKVCLSICHSIIGVIYIR